MKKLSILIFVFFLLASTAWSVQRYGQQLTLSTITKISDIDKNPEKYVGKKVLVKGLIIDVCSARGCWMDIASDEAFKKIQIKVVDGVIVFPVTAKGKTALVEGLVEALHLSYEDALWEAEHRAEEQGKKFNPSTVKGPQTIYRIRALGAEIQ